MHTHKKHIISYNKNKAPGMLLLLAFLFLNSCHIDLGYKRVDREWYWTDIEFVLYGRRYHPIPEADNRTFKPLSKNYAKDKNNVYFNDRIIDGADPKTFR